MTSKDNPMNERQVDEVLKGIEREEHQFITREQFNDALDNIWATIDRIKRNVAENMALLEGLRPVRRTCSKCGRSIQSKGGKCQVCGHENEVRP